MSDELKVAIEATKKGAEQALKYYDKPLEIKSKKDRSVFTIADLETEDAIKTYILKSFPKSKFLAEESGGEMTKNEFWIIDPIDGSRNFSRVIPLWCILIALCKKGEITLGVCYFPLLSILLYAEKKQGTFLNGKRVYVSKTEDLKNSYSTFGSPRRFKDKQALIDLIEKSLTTRSLDLAYNAALLASGKVDVLVDAYGKIWDAAPFKVIIEEAGGKVTNWQGKEWTITDEGYIATNGILHDEVIKILNNK